MKSHHRLVLFVCSVVLAGVAMIAPVSQASATPGVGVSLGEGMVVGGDKVRRTDVNLEALVFYGLGILKFDMGLLVNLENPDSPLVLRPGVRVFVPGLLYGRAAIPVSLSKNSDWGFLFGVGRNLLNLGAIKLFAELDATFMDSVSFSDAVPIELRVGLEIGF